MSDNTKVPKARDFISTIRVNRVNLENIAQYDRINGSLLIDIEKRMIEFAKAHVKEALKKAAVVHELKDFVLNAYPEDLIK